MHAIVKYRSGAHAARLSGGALIALACVALLTGQVLGQETKTKPEVKPVPATPKKSGCGGADDNTPAVLKPAQPGTQPKYYCENPVITHDSVWQGAQLKYDFKVENRGDADLRIKIKGG
jgi:hypothetical protein